MERNWAAMKWGEGIITFAPLLVVYFSRFTTCSM